MWRAILALSGVVWGGSLAAGWQIAGILAALVFVSSLGLIIARMSLVRVPEQSLAVIYNREQQAFSRLLPSGRRWLRPFVEEVRATIPLGAETAMSACQAYTSGGVPLMVRWQATFQIEPLSLSRELQARLALKLARKSKIIVQSHVNNSLQLALSHYTIHDLFAGGERGRLERAARQAATEQLAPLGITVQRVTIQEMELPAQVQSTLAAAHERAVQTESEALALAQLQKVISQFSDSDMQRLAELERLRVMGQHGVSLVYPLAAMMPPAAAATTPAPAPAHPITPPFHVEPPRREFAIGS